MTNETKQGEGQLSTGENQNEMKREVEPNVIKQPEGQKQATEGEREKKEQERTRAMKVLWIKAYMESKPVVALVCLKTGINEATFYRWYNGDPQFRADVEQIKKKRNLMAEEILNKKIFLEEKETSLHFYLRTHHPDFKEKSSVEMGGGLQVGVTSFEDALAKSEEQLQQKYARTLQGTDALHEPGAHRDGAQDQGQAPQLGAVSVEQSAGVLPVQENAQKSYIESETERVE